MAKAIVRKFPADAELCALYDINTEKSLILSKKLRGGGGLAVKSLDILIKKSDLVIEASCASVSWAIARQVLNKKRDIMIMSVGGIIDKYRRLFCLARRNKARVFIPSGAISGIDALKAASIEGIRQVELTTIKNPVSFKGVKYIQQKGIDLAGIKNEKVVFSGPAKEAVKYFPQNVNVAAILSLAGVGSLKTRVNIVASAKARRNIHEIRIVSAAGQIFTRTVNILHPDNPKTSYLAYLSAVACLKQVLDPVKIGT